MLRGTGQRSAIFRRIKLSRRSLSANNQSMKVPYHPLPPKGISTGKKVFWLLSGTVAGTGAVVIWAATNEDVRPVVEGYVPFTKPCINGIGQISTRVKQYYKKLIPTRTTDETVSPAVAREILPAVTSGEMPTLTSAEEEPATPVISLAPIVNDEPPIVVAEEPAPASPKKGSAGDVVSVKPKSFENLLSETLSEIEAAIAESKEFISAICSQAEGQDAVELDSASDESRKKRFSRIQTHVSEFREGVTEALSDAKSSANEHLVELRTKLDSAVQNLNLATLEAEAFKVYAVNYFENLKEQLANAKELAEEDVLLPVDGVDDTRLSNKELNQFVAYGYRKLKYLEEQLAKHETAAKSSLKAVLEGQRGEVGKLLTEKFEAEFAAKEQELKEDKEKSLADMEKRLREIHNDQMVRQASAYNQHLHESLQTQEKLLRAKFESNVQEVLAVEKGKHHKELSELLGQVTAINQVLIDRAKTDRQSRKSHQLWLSSQALHDELFSCDNSNDRVTLRPMLDAIKTSFGGDAFVDTLLSQFRENEEVHSHASLTERFARVRRHCRRVATVPDPPTVTAYFWSYLRSALSFDPPPMELRQDDKGNKYIDLALDTEPDNLTILTTAQHLLDNNELELCVRLLNQLEGESRNVARDWMADARRLLELRQVANGLLTFAAAKSAVGFLTYDGIN